jgi:hypothetical protein
VQTATGASAAARDLAGWLRSPEAQALLATFRKGELDDEPLFFPVEVTAAPG